MVDTNRKEADEPKCTNLCGGYALANEIRGREPSPRDSRCRRNYHKNLCRRRHGSVHAARSCSRSKQENPPSNKKKSRKVEW